MIQRRLLWCLVVAYCILCVCGGQKKRLGALEGKHGRGSLTRLLRNSLKHAYIGLGTYYHTGMGSCGANNADTDYVVAVNKEQMKNGANPNQNPRCQTKVRIYGPHGECIAKVVDTCPTCVRGNLDMSEEVFKKVCGKLSIGKCKIQWKFE